MTSREYIEFLRDQIKGVATTLPPSAYVIQTDPFFAQLKAWGDTIINYTGKDVRRVDLVFGIGYDDDIKHAIDVLREIANEHKLVLDDPPVALGVDALADSSVNLFCRPWVKTTDYWTVHWALTQQVKERFDAEGISIPYPQRDVHMHHESAPT